MPDWSYQPFLKPLLFSLSPATGRNVTLGAIGGLGESPLGAPLIDFLGHMRAPAQLLVEVMGLDFASPVGLGAGFDPAARAVRGLARFGFGFIEAGPVSSDPIDDGAVWRDGRAGTISYSQPLANPGAETTLTKLAPLGLRMPLGVRICAQVPRSPDGAAPSRGRGSVLRAMDRKHDDSWQATLGLAAEAAAVADFVVVQLPLAWLSAPARRTALVAAAGSACPLLIAVPPSIEPADLETTVGLALDAGFRGVAIVGGTVVEVGGAGASEVEGAPSWTQVGASTRATSLELVHRVRCTWGAGPAVIASGGVEEPGHALEFLDAGADLVQIHSGLVFSGPGLPKRINEALLHRALTAAGYAAATAAIESVVDASAQARSNVVPPQAGGSGGEVVRAHDRSWMGHLLVGISMVVAGLLATVVAATTVVLPYDTAFLGLSRAELGAVNPRLLSFLAHDRISLSGVMVSIGLLYMGLTWHGIRHRVHWASRAVVMSTTVGFASFFLFAAYGYFDILHAILSVMILVFFLTGLRWRADGPPQVPVPDLQNDAAWRRSLAGQLAFVVLAVGLIGGGSRIAYLGSTSVLVPEDLEFMAVTVESIAAASPRLLPLIAHDRAGFGGALLSLGLAVLGVALWGFRRGARWLWWTLLVSALPGLLAVVAVHLAVGYEDLWHLAPVILAIALTLAGLALSRTYLCEPDGQMPRGQSSSRATIAT